METTYLIITCDRIGDEVGILEYIFDNGRGVWSYWDEGDRVPGDDKDPSYKDEFAIKESDLEKTAKKLWSYETGHGTMKDAADNIFIKRNDGRKVSLNDYIKNDCSFDDALYANDFEDNLDYYEEGKVMNKKVLFEAILNESKLNEFGGPKSWSAAGRDAAATKAEKAAGADINTDGKINYNGVHSVYDIFKLAKKGIFTRGIICIIDFDKVSLVYADPYSELSEIELPFKYDSDDFSEFEWYMRNKLIKSCAKVDFVSDVNDQIDITMYVAPEENGGVVVDFWQDIINPKREKTYLGVSSDLISDESEKLLSSGRLVSHIANKAFDKCFYKG